jgi:hypothetical protein
VFATTTSDDVLRLGKMVAAGDASSPTNLTEHPVTADA